MGRFEFPAPLYGVIRQTLLSMDTRYWNLLISLPGMMSADSNWRRKPLLWLLACVLASAFVLIYPVYVIRPFRYQGARELAVALAFIRFRPIFETIVIGACVALFIWAWRQARGAWGRTAAALCALVVVSFGVLSQVNIYELMFHPLDRPTFSPASKAKLSAQEMVIAIRVRGQARAYPIRSMSYHHIVNDMVGGLPTVATY